jgi:dolichyl-phosphate-mannose-protein mannosyltransferase
LRRGEVYTLFQLVSELLFSVAVWFSLKLIVAVRNRLWNSAGFFVVVWLVHYFPFFLMSRQLFIHHYLPSHLASALVAGAVLHFLLSETIEYPISVAGHYTRPRPRQWAELGTRGPIIVVGFFIALFIAFVYIAPLTYGTPGYVSPIMLSYPSF